jgi:hypothetical protein
MGVLDRNPLRGPAFAVVFPLDIAEASRNDILTGMLTRLDVLPRLFAALTAPR